MKRQEQQNATKSTASRMGLVAAAGLIFSASLVYGQAPVPAAAAPLMAPTQPKAPDLTLSVPLQTVVKLKTDRRETLSGVGLVTGLASTGDSAKPMGDKMVNAIRQLTSPDWNPPITASKNTALVMIMIDLPPQVVKGQEVEGIISSVHDCQDLTGGVLIMTEMVAGGGARKVLLGTAQGEIKMDPASPTKTKGKVTVRVEKDIISCKPDEEGFLSFVIDEKFRDYITASNIKNRLLRELGDEYNANTDFPASIKDAPNPLLMSGFIKEEASSMVKVKVPLKYRNDLGTFLHMVMSVQLDKSVLDNMPRVIINERTKTVIVNDKVRIQPLMFSHGTLRLGPLPEGSLAQIQQDQDALRNKRPDRAAFSLHQPSYRTQEDNQELVKLQDIIDAFNRVGAKPQDVIDLIRAMRDGGMLKAHVIEIE